MAKRNTQNYLGDLGEAEAYIELLRIGAGINSLTQSDSGWDLHLHLPAKPMILTSTGSASWELGGRAAHVQVKKQTSRSAPKLGIGTARGWITGTVAGTPSFLFIVDGKKNIQYATPCGISDWLEGRHSMPNENRRAIAGMKLNAFEASRFSRISHLWSAYPNVLLGLSGLDRALHGCLHPDWTDVSGWISEIALGWFNVASIGNDDTGYWWSKGSDFFDTAARAMRLDEPGLEEVYQSLEEMTQQALAPRWSTGWDLGLPVGVYTKKADPDSCRTDAVNMIEEVFSALPRPARRKTKRRHFFPGA
ncbi:hypothetical protein GCM10010172_67730 [Paractinoplanes ferrugineus]|uniref:Uncharacterized protein n=1 Tax=Paractinoplanes ferrugineus TaxID=113564 RepID=A0A919MAX9_9ACTN|nr:hypothetical protein [Actinoplanes ferrugineus]GIE13066.1 hypothetical protein Afe05nite_49060 [Actinoplanes ferrugineus]